MLDRTLDNSFDPERRREAVRIGRRALGRGLQRLFDDALTAPTPEEWLELLRKAEERERDSKT